MFGLYMNCILIVVYWSLYTGRCIYGMLIYSLYTSCINVWIVHELYTRRWILVVVYTYIHTYILVGY